MMRFFLLLKRGVQSLSVSGALLGLLIIALPARANLKQFDVFIGYDSIVPEGQYFPVTCEVFNDGPGFNAVFELSSSQYGRGQVRRLKLELPTGTKKQFVLPVFNSMRFNVSFDATLYDSRGNKRAELKDIRARGVPRSRVPLLGALSRTVPGQPVFPAVNKNYRDSQPWVARLQPGLFPDNPLALEGLTALYLNTEKALNLSVPQVNALLAWQSAGGHLIVSIEQAGDLSGLPWLRDLVPFVPEGARNLSSHAELHAWLTDSPPVANALEEAKRRTTSGATAYRGYGKLAEDAGFEGADLQVLTGRMRDGRAALSVADVPLVIQAQRGRGLVTVLTFSPEREPLRSWKHRAYFWARLLELPSEWFSTVDKNTTHYDQGGYAMDSVFGAMVDSKQIRKLPVGWLLLLLLAYLAVIGPVDQYWLKKINRQMLTWLTFPAYVVFFSLLIYFIGYKLRAGDSEWNEFHVVDIFNGANNAALRGRTFAAVYSPANATYPVEGTQNFATLRGEYAGPYSGSENSRAEVEHRGNNFTAQVTVPVWTSQLFVGDWWHSTKTAPLTATVKDSGNQYEIKVQNNLASKLTLVKVAIGARLYDLGEMQGNTTRTFMMDRMGGQPLRDFTRPFLDQFYRAANSRRQALGDSSQNIIPDEVNASVAASFLQMVEDPNNYQRFQAPNGFDQSRQLTQGNAVLCAWLPERSLISPLNQFTPLRSKTDTMLRVVVPVK